jgi:hypothetical protein
MVEFLDHMLALYSDQDAAGTKALTRIMAALQQLSRERLEYDEVRANLPYPISPIAMCKHTVSMSTLQKRARETGDVKIAQTRSASHDRDLNHQHCHACAPSRHNSSFLDNDRMDGANYQLVDTSLHHSMNSSLCSEAVLWLEESFGQVFWPNSIHGKTNYDLRWHLDHVEEKISDELRTQSHGSDKEALFQKPCPESPLIEIGTPPGSSPMDVTMIEHLAGPPPWPEVMGYESDGHVSDKDTIWIESAADSGDKNCERSTEAKQSSTGMGTNPIISNLSHLREAVKTVAVSSRTGVPVQETKRAADNWIIRCFFMTPLELVVTKIQRYWRKKRAYRAYIANIQYQYTQQRELIRRHAQVHRSLMKHQEDIHQQLVNRVRMFDCEKSKEELRKYRAARLLQCAMRRRQAKAWMMRFEAAAHTIQKLYRRWVGSRVAVWKRNILLVHAERDLLQLFRRQKFVAKCVAEDELEILESYAEIEKDMIKCRRDIEVQEQTAEETFVRRARQVHSSVLASADLEAWVPQTGSVSGKIHYLHTVTGEVQQHHPLKTRIDQRVQQVRERIDREQRPMRQKMLAKLEGLKGQHEDVYEKVAVLLFKLRQLSFRAQFR